MLLRIFSKSVFKTLFTNCKNMLLKICKYLTIIPRTRVGYKLLSHVFKNTANQRSGLPLHILQYATGSIPLYFPVITCAQQFTGFLLRTSHQPAPKLFNSCEPLRTFPIMSGQFPIIFEHFRIFSNTFKDFRKFSKNFKTILDRFQSFPKIALDFPKFS